MSKGKGNNKIDLGMTHVYYDPETGDLEVEKSRLRTVEGGRHLYDPDADIGDDDDDDDDSGDDEDGDEDGDDDSGDDEDGDDEDGDDNGDDDSGDESGGKKRRKSRRSKRKGRRAERKENRQERRAERRGDKKKGGNVRKVSSVETVSSTTPTVAGQEMTLEFRADEKFAIERLTFAGDDDARLKSIFIGRQAIFNSSNGTRLSEFKSTNLQTLRMKGAVIPRGAYIRIKIEASAALQIVDANLYGTFHEQRGC